MLEYNPSYTESIGKNEFYLLDTTRSGEETKYTSRQVQHGENDAGDGWEARNFVDGTNATVVNGS